MKSLVIATGVAAGIASAFCLAGPAALAGPEQVPAPPAAKAPALAAHRRAPAPRRWTRTDGVQLTGVFVGVHGSIVALKETGGRNVFWNFEQLSAGDRDFLVREYAAFGPPSARPQPAAPTRQQIVTDRMAKVAQRAESAKAQPDGQTARTVAAPVNER